MFFVDRLKHFHSKNGQKFNISLKSKHFPGAFDARHHLWMFPEGAIIKNLKINIVDSEMWQELKVKSPSVHC